MQEGDTFQPAERHRTGRESTRSLSEPDVGTITAHTEDVLLGTSDLPPASRSRLRRYDPPK